MADWYVQGDSQTAPQWVSVVRTSHEKALAAATPTEEATLGVRNITVYLIIMKGRFLPLPVSSPVLAGKEPPPGRYLSIVVDASTFGVLDVALSQKPPTVAPASLGPPTFLNVGVRSRPAPGRVATTQGRSFGLARVHCA